MTGDTGLPEVQADLGAHVPTHVLQLSRLWSPGQSLQVCFFGGSDMVRRRIRDAAVAWLQHGNLQLDFGSAEAMRSCAAGDGSNIRIGFGYPGYWSVVGNAPVDIGVQTMNYGWFDAQPPPEPRFSAVVLHTFGHALGFRHEDQRPRGACEDQINWPMVYAELAKAPNFWAVEKADANLRGLGDGAAYGLSAVDRTSIMQYSLEPWMFRNGEQSQCYVREQLGLAPLDMQGMAYAYPRDAASGLAQRRHRIARLIESLPAEATSARRYLQRIDTALAASRIVASHPQ